mgnify:FL=1
MSITREALLNVPLTKIEKQLSKIKPGETLAKLVIINGRGGNSPRREDYKNVLVIDSKPRKGELGWELELRSPGTGKGHTWSVYRDEITTIRPTVGTRLARAFNAMK